MGAALPAEDEPMDFFALMDCAMAEMREGDPVEEGRPIVLDDGRVHYCLGGCCPHVELNDDQEYVCGLTGVVIGTRSVRDDYSTGRKGGSNNPDDRAGQPVGGTWRPRKNMSLLSHAAFLQAALPGDADAEADASTPTAAARELAGKRGARCVDDDAALVPPKRARGGRALSHEAFCALVSDAELIMSRLVVYERKPKIKAPRDKRLGDERWVFGTALKRYLKECIAAGTKPTLDAIHNLALAARTLASGEREAAAARQGHNALLLTVRMRQMVPALAAQLWIASGQTPYMCRSRRGADAYRPFVCGVLYALKRGVTLPDGTVVVPACPELTEALPVLRATAQNSAAKALHASSHRGLCTLHRAAASCLTAETRALWDEAARSAKQLTTAVASGAFQHF